MIRNTLNIKNVPGLSLSVRAKLLSSFTLISLTTLAACFIAIYSFSVIEDSLRKISDDSVPAMSAAMTLAENSSFFENSIPLMSNAQNDKKRSEINTILISKLNALEQVASELKDNDELKVVVVEMRDELIALNESTKERISTKVVLDAKVAEMYSLQRELNTQLITGLDDAAFNLEIEAEDIQFATDEALDKLVGQSLMAYSESLSLMSDLYQLLLSYKAAVLAIDVDQVRVQHDHAQGLVQNISNRQVNIGEDYLSSELTEAIQEFTGHATSENNIFNLRTAELSSAEQNATDSREIYLQAEKEISGLVESVNTMKEDIGVEVVIATGSLRDANATGIPHLMDPGFSSLQLILEYRANSNNFFGILSQISQTSSSENLVPLVERLQANTDTLMDAIDQLETFENGSNLKGLITKLVDLGQNDGGIVQLKELELDTRARFTEVVDSTKGSLDHLKGIVSQLVDSSQMAVESSSSETFSTIATSRYLLTIFAVGVLLMTILLLWLLVSRNILKRLHKVTLALSDISRGNLDHKVNVSGRDELAQLAKIVDVFREKSLENQRLQEEQRQASEDRIRQVEEKKQLEDEQKRFLEEQRRQEQEQSERERKQADALRRDTDSLLSVVRSAAQGDLTQPITVKGDHPTGQLAEGLAALIDSFSQVMNQITRTTDIVASGTQKIVNGNGLLSERTEKQTESLKSTAISMSDINKTVDLNYSSASNATTLASDAQEHTQHVGKVVKEAVDAMKQINDSSAEMTAIVGVIDEIAFQTNLLALNASVEAARAGEQGRGFAVVASEVRNLAARSAVAASEIKTLIEDSVEKVNQGVDLVGKSEISLESVLTSVQDVTGMVAEISENAENQRSGISSVNDSINVLEKTTGENADMVEQVISLSTEMADQTVSLREQIAFFTFNPDQLQDIKPSKKAA